MTPTPEPDHRSKAGGLNKAVKVGIGWAIVERGVLQVLNVASSVVLARLLSPSDFGVMGIAILFTGLSTRLARFGFGMALVRRQTITPEHVSAMFVLTLSINGTICAALMAASPWAGRYFGNELAGDVLAVMSLNFLIRCIGACPSAILRRQMNFRAMTAGSILDCIVKLGTAVVLAFWGFGVWSLAFGELAGGLTEKIYMAVAARWRPSLRTTRSAIGDLFSFGAGVSLKSTFIYLFENVDNFVVAKWLGTAPLGLYEKSYRLMNLPVTELSARVNVVLFPAFARLHEDRGRLRAAFRKTVLSLSLVGWPLFASFVVLGDEVIRVMYGSRWLSAALPFQILCIAGVPRVLTQIMASAINACGIVAAEVSRRVIAFLLLIVACLIGSQWGIVGIAVGVTAMNLVSAALILSLLAHHSPIRYSDVLTPQAVPATATVALLLVERGIRLLVPAGHPALLPLAIAAGGAIYVATLFLFRTEPLRQLFGELRRDLNPVLKHAPFAFARRIP